MSKLVLLVLWGFLFITRIKNSSPPVFQDNSQFMKLVLGLWDYSRKNNPTAGGGEVLRI